MAEEQQYHAFEENAIEDLIASVQAEPDMQDALKGGRDQSMSGMMESTSMYRGAQCISITVENNQVCLNLPRPISRKFCLPVPKFIPNGQKVEACIGVCFIGPIPTGLKLTVSFNGNVFFQQSWGKC